MELVAADSRLDDATLRSMLDEHLEGLEFVAGRLQDGERPPTDVARLALARSFAENAAVAVRALVATGDGRPGLIRAVNLSYEAMLIVIDYRKLFSGGPTVPQGPKGRTRSARRPTRTPRARTARGPRPTRRRSSRA